MNRLAIVAEFIQPDRRAIPSSIRTWAIEGFLRAKGWKVQVIAPLLRGTLPSSKVDGETVDRVKSYEARRDQVGSPLAAIFSPASIAAYRRRFRSFCPDVVLISGSSPFILWEPLLAAKLLGIPAVFDVHDSWLIMSAVHPGRIRNWIRRAMEKQALRKGDLVVGVTESQEQLLRDLYGIDAFRLLVIPNGLHAQQERHATSVQTYDLIHAGPPRDYYDTGTFLDAIALLARRLPRIRVAFIGIRDGSEKTHWQAEIARRNLDPVVDLLPPVPYTCIPETLRIARVGVVTISRHRAYKAGISTKSYDYLASGLPILYLGPRDSEQGRLVEGFGVGCAAETPADFARLAEQLLTDPNAIPALTPKIAAAARHFDWKNILGPLAERLELLRRPKVAGGT
jgi:glycosyltransferase involved in cell wall biosynthesis